MNPLNPDDNFSSLRACLRAGAPPVEPLPDTLPAEPSLDYAVRRFLRAWQRTGSFARDESVLLRQAVRWTAGGRIYLGTIHPELEPWLAGAGLRWSAADGELSAAAYTPCWLENGVECDPVPQRRARDEAVAGEPFLPSAGYTEWRSTAQKEAAWETLTAPPGATRVVVLPTGCGKSLCFQLLPRFDPGLTVVVVPTIALAIDQHRNACGKLAGLPGVDPVYFASDEDPDAVAAAVRERRTRLLFTSPESCVSGRLREILDKHAADGWLRNLVIDESHLIETWGAHFRVEFQLLASKRRHWLSLSEGQLRTFLFSATMSRNCRGLLLAMFSEPGKGREFVCQRLRPEMIYFHRQFAGRDESAERLERDRRLLEALRQLPRPAILYVTKVSEAIRYEELLREEEGYRRAACFHGDTPSRERRELLTRWGANELDLMVATSAFGVGVDKPDVRAVVHACFPENLDRCYQEVGRGGRDGWSTVCLWLPTVEDAKTARGINVRLMTPEILQERWASMYEKRRPVEAKPYRHRLPVDAARPALQGEFTGKENIRWNKRLLLQLHRAGRLRIDGLELEDTGADAASGRRREWVEVEVLNFAPDTTRLAELITEERDAELARFDQGYYQLQTALGGKECMSLTLGKLYGVGGAQRVCGGCPACRAKGWPVMDCPPLHFEAIPAGPGHGAVMLDGAPDPRAHREKDEFSKLLARFLSRGIRRFLAPDEHFPGVGEILAETVLGNESYPYRLDGFGAETAIRAEPDEFLVFFHIGVISAAALHLGRGCRSLHVRCAVRNAADADGRDVSVREGGRYYHSPAEWFAAHP